MLVLLRKFLPRFVKIYQMHQKLRMNTEKCNG